MGIVQGVPKLIDPRPGFPRINRPTKKGGALRRFAFLLKRERDIKKVLPKIKNFLTVFLAFQFFDYKKSKEIHTCKEKQNGKKNEKNE